MARCKLFLSFLMAGVVTAWSQVDPNTLQQDPLKGFFPSVTFAISGLENVNTATGGLGLHIQIASLPAGRGGVTGSVSFDYTSKQWQATADVRGVTQNPNPGSPCITANVYTLFNNFGGWNLSLAYSVLPTEKVGLYDSSGCAVPSVCPAAPGASVAYTNYKYQLVFPDGSLHDLAIAGHEQESDSAGYYDVDGQGLVENCFTPGGNASPPSGSTLNAAGGFYTYTVGTVPQPFTLYTTDGTYIRIIQTPLPTSTNPAGSVFSKLSFTDGRTIVDSCVAGTENSGLWSCAQYTQTFYDRNAHHYSLTHQLNLSTAVTTWTLTDEIGNSIREDVPALVKG